MKIPDLNPRFVVNEDGERVAVIIDIQTFETICDLLEDLADIEEIERRRAEPNIPHDEAMKLIREDADDLRILREAQRAHGSSPTISLDEVKREFGLD
jgi:hypothetical protein